MKSEHLKCVLVADRHHGLSDAVRGLLETVFEAVVMVADPQSLLESVTRLQPTLVIADLSLARSESLDWLARVKTNSPASRIVVLSVHDEPTATQSVLSIGADAVVLKRRLATDLLPTIDDVLSRPSHPDVAAPEGPPEKSHP
jgi:DNA-binding NarL/FixJ family response regulator